MDKISIKNLKIPGKHGVYDFEKKTNGIFELDIDLYFDLVKAGNSDNLKDTIDYANVVDLTIEIFNKKRYSLIESLAEKICDILLSNFPIEKIMLKIRKPHAPIEANFDSVQVQLIRERS